MKSHSLRDLTVACVYSRCGITNTNDWCGAGATRVRKVCGFTDEYVHRMQASVKRYIGAARFVCLTNHYLSNIETIPLEQNAGGWWDKLELFRRGIFDCPVLYFDLDTMIVADMRDMLSAITSSRFAAIRERSVPVMGSSVMAFDGTYDWGELSASRNGEYADSVTISRYVGERNIHFIDDEFPGRFRYYGDVKRSGRTGRESVVVFQRYPRPHQVGWSLT